MATPTPPPTRSNRLASERSPYLQQHATNPVDWYPWGEEAFAAARTANKPIFLSIGYSTCHWCHVMAHESFEDEAVAEIMNRHYINIKVDREERPDVDAIYMTAVQAITGSGGWPMSVWLTPDLRPYYGGTYFPPDERWGRPSFSSVLLQLSDAFQRDKERVADAAGQITELLQHAASSSRPTEGIPPASSAGAAAFDALSSSYDRVQGGFSTAPKFPMPVYLEFLLDYHERTRDPAALEMAATTFRKMGNGGIYDQLGGGFSRYSTDGQWLVPHFEKMLYDNAQLMRAGAGLFAVTRDAFFSRIVKETADYLVRDLRHPLGGFYSAEDADSEGKEGTFYLWTLADLRAALGQDAELAAHLFGVTVDGNFSDPHSQDVGRNVLRAASGSENANAKFGLVDDSLTSKRSQIRRALFEVRNKRVRPHRDEKIITEWNGLAISAFARAGFILDDPSLIEAAELAANFIATSLYDEASGRLWRRWRDGHRAVDGQLADYAMLIEGLLDLFETTGNPARLQFAMQLQEVQDRIFLDSQNGGYFVSAASPDLLVRMKEDADNVIPSGNATAARNGLRLAAITGRQHYRTVAEKVVRYFSPALRNRPSTLAKLTSLLPWLEGGLRQVVIAGGLENSKGRSLIAALRRAAPRNATVVLARHGQDRDRLNEMIPALLPLISGSDTAVAYVCENFSCHSPSVDPEAFSQSLTAPNAD